MSGSRGGAPGDALRLKVDLGLLDGPISSRLAVCQAISSLRSFDAFDTHRVPFATATPPGSAIAARSATRLVFLSRKTRCRPVSIHSSRRRGSSERLRLCYSVG
jgi:hypothetical protein